ncbi:MAG TPA: preprotein translocase subunit SecE [Alphaproteobacteria bacterium]|jgi:preprotein translocase subunit SecE|nr:preprotein translocase subunit SecE [Alphaproteobacteria bacterium]
MAGKGDKASGRFYGNVMAKTSPFEFIQQVRRETAKVTWPTRNETAVTTLMVFIMVALASVFFAVVDMVLQFGVKYLLGAGG